MIPAFCLLMNVSLVLFICRAILTTIVALLPPPFMSYHRRSLSQSAATRPRALSHASMPENNLSNCSPMAVRNANCTMPLPSSPVRTRRALGAVGNVMSTPPPNRALSAQLKLKGSLTDPAQPRRREAFGAVSWIDYFSSTVISSCSGPDALEQCPSG